MLFRTIVFFSLVLALQIPATGQHRDSVFIKVAGGMLGATLTRPASASRPPVVLIIPGSGGVDRNGNGGMMVNDHLKQLGDSLASHGIASLRYDKRGVGVSSAITDERRIRFTDYAPDVIACYDWLKQQKRFGRIYIAGHGEGALIAMLAAQSRKPAGVIALASPGEPIDRLLVRQFTRQGQHEGTIDSTRMYFNELRETDTVLNVPRIPFYASMFRPSVQKYLASWMKYDPVTEMAKVPSPVLMVYGTHDLQMDSTQRQLLQRARPDAEVVVIPGMNHILRQAPAEVGENMNSMYDTNKPLDKTLLNALSSFILNTGREQ